LFSPGNSPGIATAASVQFEKGPSISGGPTLVVELAGTAPGSQYDQLHVTGQLSLGGTLQVLLTNDFAPAAGNSFDILDWGSVHLSFDSLVLPALAGLSWDTSRLYLDGVISVTSPGFLPADFDEDHDVDVQDFANWTTNFGTSAGATHMHGDADADHDVDGADFLAWQRQLGSVNMAADASARSVPEPNAWGLSALSASVFALGRRRRNSIVPAHHTMKTSHVDHTAR
jgi:hypothetical protein